MENNIFRFNKFDNFTIVGNDILQDENITMFSKGLLVYLLSLPKDWNINVKVISNKFNEKESRILRAFKELIDIGYCLRKPNYVNGKLSGQSYFITNSRGEFGENIQPPQKNGGLTYTAPPKKQSTGKTVPLKKQGSLQSTISINKEYIVLNKEAENEFSDTLFPEIEIEEKLRGTTEKAKCLFSNSRFSKFEDFEKCFKGDDYKSIDIYYYYQVVKDWSASKGRLQKDWIAQTRNIIRSDKEKNKLKLKVEYQTQKPKLSVSDAMDYLKNDY